MVVVVVERASDTELNLRRRNYSAQKGGDSKSTSILAPPYLTLPLLTPYRLTCHAARDLK